MNMRIGLVRTLLPALILAFFAAHADPQDTRPVPAATLRAILAGPQPVPGAGAEHARVTVIDYFDYDCPVCKRLEPELRKLLEHDPTVRVVHKDWPIFGEASEYAAYCSFAAARLGQYQGVHDALIDARRDLDSKEAVRAVLKGAGFDVRKFDADIESHAKEYADVLARNRRETAALGLKGTPGLIVGDRLVLGAVDYARLLQLVAASEGTATSGAGSPRKTSGK
jgi:protein-disulfide isomerase